MPNITFKLKDGTEKLIDAPIGLSLMEVAVKHQIDTVEGTCGGGLACATCHVYVHPDWWDKCLPDGEKSDDEEDMGVAAWAGVLPFSVIRGEPIRHEACNIDAPIYVRAWQDEATGALATTE